MGLSAIVAGRPPPVDAQAAVRGRRPMPRSYGGVMVTKTGPLQAHWLSSQRRKLPFWIILVTKHKPSKRSSLTISGTRFLC